jgi:hypothetical protein
MWSSVDIDLQKYTDVIRPASPMNEAFPDDLARKNTKGH